MIHTSRRLAAALTVALAALTLSGCISLLPKSKPAQLYRFGYNAEAPGPAAPAGPSFAVMKPPVSFPREASMDRILTVNGASVAYVGEARWVAPATVLFDEAVASAFAAGKGPAQLVGRGEAHRADYTLKIEVRAFEARYTHGGKAAPDIVVIFEATLTPTDHSAPRSQTFEVTVTAAENRVGPIVDAFNQALAQLLPQLAQWVDSAGPGKE